MRFGLWPSLPDVGSLLGVSIRTAAPVLHILLFDFHRAPTSYGSQRAGRSFQPEGMLAVAQGLDGSVQSVPLNDRSAILECVERRRFNALEEGFGPVLFAVGLRPAPGLCPPVTLW